MSGGNIALQHIGGVELAQELNHFRLGRRIVAQLRGNEFPDILDRALPIHQADEGVGRGRKPMKPFVRPILQHVPGLTAILVAMQLCVAAQAWGQGRHAIPGRAKEGFTHSDKSTWRIAYGTGTESASRAQQDGGSWYFPAIRYSPYAIRT